jgi:hypothetical protein
MMVRIARLNRNHRLDACTPRTKESARERVHCYRSHAKRARFNVWRKNNTNTKTGRSNISLEKAFSWKNVFYLNGGV